MLGEIATLCVAALRFRLMRIEIAGHSMEPTLCSGDRAVGVARPGRLEVGDVVVFADPARPDFELVKRVTRLDGDRFGFGGDHPAHGDDGRAMPRCAVTARLVAVYHPRFRMLGSRAGAGQPR